MDEQWIVLEEEVGNKNNLTTCEIEEVRSTDLFDLQLLPDIITEEEEHEDHLVRSNNRNEDSRDIYVAVGKSVTSTDALLWALKHLVTANCFLYLVHVFPQIRTIPTPLGRFAKEQLRADQVETYMAMERGKRRELLQKFFNLCTTSKVNVDTVLIESDNTTKAVLDLIPILNIQTLVVGTTKSSVRKLRKLGDGIANQILNNAPDFCQVKIISEGKNVGVKNANHLEENSNESTITPCICFTRRRYDYGVSSAKESHLCCLDQKLVCIKRFSSTTIIS